MNSLGVITEICQLEMQFPTLSMKIKQNFEYDGSKQPDELYICTSLIWDGSHLEVQVFAPQHSTWKSRVLGQLWYLPASNINWFEARHTLKM